MGLGKFIAALKEGWKNKDTFIRDAHETGLSVSPYVPGAIVPYQADENDDEGLFGEIVLGGTAHEIADKAKRLLAPREHKPQF